MLKYSKNLKWTRSLTTLTALSAVLVAAGLMAEAQGKNTSNVVTKPIKVTGGGTAPGGLSVVGEDSPHNATGTANHLGAYSGDEGIAKVIPSVPGTFKGSFVFVAANGDRLACTYGDTDNGAASVGTFALEPAGGDKVIIVFVAEFNPFLEECTGKFAKLTGGSFELVATSEPIDFVIDEFGFTPPFAYTWEGQGTLEFAKGN